MTSTTDIPATTTTASSPAPLPASHDQDTPPVSGCNDGLPRLCARSHAWLSPLCLFACLLLAWPVIIAPSPAAVGWDDAYYLHRAACITHAIFEPTLTDFSNCLALVVKAPLMAWLAWPWGAQAATSAGIGLPFVSLAVLTFGVVIAIAEVMLWLASPPLLILLAFASLSLNQLLWVIAGGYEGDTLVSLLVVLLGLLVPLEFRCSRRGLWHSIARGLAWGAVIALGVMTKTSFGYFAALLGPALLYLRASRTSLADGAIAATAGLVTIAPVVAYHLVHWDTIIGHVLISTVGAQAKYTSYGLGFGGYLVTLFGRWGWFSAVVGAALVATLAATLISRPSLHAKRSVRTWAWLGWPALVLVGYLLLTASSQNHDLRYGLPFLVGLPFALAALATAEPAGPVLRCGTPTNGVLAVLLVSVLLSIPMIQRPDLRYVSEARTVLAALPNDRPFTLLVASDDSAINLETFLLAQQLDLQRFGRLHIDTVVYDEMLGHSETEMIDRLTQADGVVLLSGLIRKAPEWTNRHAASFREHILAKGAHRQDVGLPFLELYLR